MRRARFSRRSCVSVQYRRQYAATVVDRQFVETIVKALLAATMPRRAWSDYHACPQTSSARAPGGKRAAPQAGLIGISIKFGTPDEIAASRAGAISAARSILRAEMPIEAASARKSMAGSTLSM